MENQDSTTAKPKYVVKRSGPVTFAISKPKRQPHKMRQTRLKNVRRAR